MNVKLETKNLILTPIQLSDAEAIFHFFTAKVTTYMIPAPATKIDETLDFINHSIKLREENKEIVWVARLKFDDTFVGCMGLHRMDTKTPELGLWIQEGLFGKKLGFEAMTEIVEFAKSHFEIEYFKYPVDRRNIASRNIPETLGGILKKTYQTIGRAGNVMQTLEYWIYPKLPNEYEKPLCLFQGDSITDCGRHRQDDLSLGDGYVKELAPYFPQVRFINKGISGDRTEELLKRWDEDVIAYQPDILSLLCGVNDVWHHYHFGKPMNPQMFETNLEALINQTIKQSKHTKILLIEPFSYSIGAFDISWRPMLDEMISRVRKLAQKYQLNIIHMDQHMKEWQKNYPQEAILGDGVHPTELGHQWMAKTIKPVLRDMLLDIQEKRLSQSKED